MAAYRYEAVDATGRVVSGLLQADTARHARTQLRAQGLLPSAVDAVGASDAQRSGRRRVATGELTLLTRQLATLLDSGLTVADALDALLDETADPAAREVIAGVKAEVSAGRDLAGALKTFPRAFPDFYGALVHAGEQSGALPTVLQHLADYMEAAAALKHKTALALLYPALVAIVAFAIVSGLLVYVVPQVAQVFNQSNQALPVLTRVVIGVSEFLKVTWPYLAAALALGAIGARTALRRHEIRKRWHGFLLKAPAIGTLVRAANIARFAATLAILVRGGVPLLAALGPAGRVVTNAMLSDAIADAATRIAEGSTFSRALHAANVFPPLLVHLVASGEATGDLARMLEHAARLETQTLERRLAVFVTLLEPAMILTMGALVLVIVLAILMPIVEMNQLVR
ncbi:MAG TPA: type II secretion system inner membrane protein GspF [Burkholderiales bacterium]|nr:type II secretion system inner membrane protein GspF [Burkholderiales bacterium]